MLRHGGFKGPVISAVGQTQILLSEINRLFAIPPKSGH